MACRWLCSIWSFFYSNIIYKQMLGFLWNSVSDIEFEVIMWYNKFDSIISNISNLYDALVKKYKLKKYFVRKFHNFKCFYRFQIKSKDHSYFGFNIAVYTLYRQPTSLQMAHSGVLLYLFVLNQNCWLFTRTFHIIPKKN